MGAIAGRTVGAHFRPVRRSPLHDWHAKNGATFIDAGVWKRAWYYAWAGDTPETAYIKEMELVRKVSASPTSRRWARSTCKGRTRRSS